MSELATDSFFVENPFTLKLKNLFKENVGIYILFTSNNLSFPGYLLKSYSCQQCENQRQRFFHDINSKILMLLEEPLKNDEEEFYEELERLAYTIEKKNYSNKKLVKGLSRIWNFVATERNII
jgi:hypothetical protein